MGDLDRKGFLIAAGALAIAPRLGLEERTMRLPRSYVPEDARPYYHPIHTLKEEHVDPLIWPAVAAINRSGWVWTLESCEGHGGERGGWTDWPLLRLAVHHGMAARMFGLLHRSVPVSKQLDGALRVVTWRHVKPPMDGWFECRVSVTGSGLLTADSLRASRRAFEKFGDMVNK